MPGDRIFDPSGSLAIRDPQDNGSTSDKIRNPPRYMQFGGLKSGSTRGLMENDFKVRPPGSTISKVPVGKNPRGY
jgi:hypothetical protein